MQTHDWLWLASLLFGAWNAFQNQTIQTAILKLKLDFVERLSNVEREIKVDFSQRMTRAEGELKLLESRLDSHQIWLNNQQELLRLRGVLAP